MDGSEHGQCDPQRHSMHCLVLYTPINGFINFPAKTEKTSWQLARANGILLQDFVPCDEPSSLPNIKLQDSVIQIRHSSSSLALKGGERVDSKAVVSEPAMSWI